ncbi:MAG: hypothetical protein ACYDIA_11055 [Candidatus Humimicrobiaceae bacterium]
MIKRTSKVILHYEIHITNNLLNISPYFLHISVVLFGKNFRKNIFGRINMEVTLDRFEEIYYENLS